MKEQAYQVLARAKRPQRFEDVLGQTHVTRTIQNALASGKLAHAYLFCGPRGVGKTSTARILAMAVNCTALEGPPPEPCGRCDACSEVKSARSLDVVEMDAASHGRVDEARDLREAVAVPPVLRKKKVYIIDEVHQMSRDAFDALLKTLEEPPAHVLFILATTESAKVPATIVSRCQRHDFRSLARAELVGALARIVQAEKLPIESDAIGVIAEAAEGGVRDALSMLDQAASLVPESGGAVTAERISELLGAVRTESFVRFAEAVRAADAGAALTLLSELADRGVDWRRFALGLLEHFRRLLLCAVHPEPQRVLDVTEGALAAVRRQAAEFTAEDLIHACRIVAGAEEELRRTGHPRLALELAAVRLCVLPKGSNWRSMLARLDALAGGAAPAAASLSPVVAPASRPPVFSPPPVARVAPAPAFVPREERPTVSVSIAPAPAPSRAEVVHVATEPPRPQETGAAVPIFSEIEEAGTKGGASEALEAVRAAWSQVEHRIGEARGPLAAAAFAAASVAKIVGSAVHLSFSNVMAHDRAAQPDNLKAATTALAEALPGTSYTVHVAPVAPTTQRYAPPGTRSGKPAGPRPPTPEEIEAVKNDPAVKRAIEYFDGEIVEIRRT